MNNEEKPNKVQVHYIAGNEVRVIEIDRVHDWTRDNDNSTIFTDEEGKVIAEFQHCVAAIRL